MTPRPPSCQDLDRLTGRYLDGLLPPELREPYEQHLLICRDCLVHLDRLRTARELLGQLPRPYPSRELVLDVVAYAAPGERS